MKNRIILGVALVILVALVTACGGLKSAESGTNTTSKTPVPTYTSSRQVRVTITDKGISSSMKTFQAGVPYFFVVTNDGSTSHNFIIKKYAEGSEPGTPQAQEGVIYTVGRIAPGATHTFTYQFPIVSPQTHLQFASQLSGPGGHEIYVPVEVSSGGNQP
ncbi:MAG TPA: hypothetical protein VJ761_24560 [Ktedonobacteraceae bacterium]|nr:hypothetical protein [Ktedonobacteraceae bacterium]